MTPLPPLAAPETASVPADHPLSVSRGNLIPELNAALSGCAIITAEDGVIVVEPLHFHRIERREGRDVLAKSHVTLNSEALSNDPA
jgi:hypothetical protein